MLKTWQLQKKPLLKKPLQKKPLLKRPLQKKLLLKKLLLKKPLLKKLLLKKPLLKKLLLRKNNKIFLADNLKSRGIGTFFICTHDIPLDSKGFCINFKKNNEGPLANLY